MAFYRRNRNIEASIIEFITQKLIDDGWSDVKTCKTIRQAFKYTKDERKPKSSICVRCPDSNDTGREIGSKELFKRPSVLIDIFATNDGMKLDLTDWFVDTIKYGCPFYEYEFDKNAQGHKVITNQTQNGKLELVSFTSNRNVDVGEGTDKLNKHRRIISMVMYVTGD